MSQNFPTLDGDDLLRIVADVGNGTSMARSKVEYNADARRFRKEIEAELRDRPGEILDVPEFVLPEDEP